MTTNWTRPFGALIANALAGLALSAGCTLSATAQSGDLPPELIVPLAPGDPRGVFRAMVASDDGQVIAAYTAGPMAIPGLPPFPLTAQVIVIDRQQGTVELASRSPAGELQNFSITPAGVPVETGPLSISRDGRFVAFVSGATNLDPLVSTPGAYTYLYDRHTQEVRALTADELLFPGFRGASGRIDGAATKVVFHCRSLAGLPAFGDEFAFCERRLGELDVRVIRRGFDIGDVAGNFQLSRDGGSIAFASEGPILTSGEPNPGRISQLYVLRIDSGQLELISRAPDGAPGDNMSGGATYFAMSDDADFVAYLTAANNIAPDVAPPGPKLLITQRSTGITRRAGTAGSMGLIAPALSGDGRRLVYLDYGYYLIGDLLRVYDWHTDSSRPFGRPASGQSNGPPCRYRPLFTSPPLNYWQGIAISGDGRTAVFASLASNLFPGDTPDTCDLFAQTLGPVPQPPAPALPVPGPGRLPLVLLALLVVSGAIAVRGRHWLRQDA